MRFIEFPEMNFVFQGIEDVKIPKMVRVLEKYEDDRIEDVRSHLVSRMEQTIRDKECNIK